MAQKKYSYLDICVLPQVSPHVVSSRAALVFDKDLKHVLWANAEGLTLLGAENIRDALDHKTTLNSATQRQIDLATGQLANEKHASGTMRLRRSFKTHLLNFDVTKIAISKGTSAVLLVSAPLQANQNNLMSGQSLMAALKGYGNAAALIDAKGKLIAASDNFDDLAISATVLKTLVKEVSSEDDRMVKRALKTKSGNLPTGIGRLDDDASHHLLLIADADDESLAAEEALRTSDEVIKAVTKTKKPASKKERKPTGVGAFSNRRDGSGRNSMGRWYFKNEDADAEEEKPKQPKKAASKRSATKKKIAVKSTQPKSFAKKAPTKKASTKKIPPKKPTVKTTTAETKPKAAEKVAAKPVPKTKAEAAVQKTDKAPKTENVTSKKPASVNDRVSIVNVARGQNSRSNTQPKVTQVKAGKVSTPKTTVHTAKKSPRFMFNASDKPVRFVWEMDADHRFTKVSKEFAETVGPNAADIANMKWNDVAAKFDIVNGNDIETVLNKGGTWSGKTVLWPIEGTDLNVPIDLAGLPSYGRDREFAGFNGFGIIRSADAMIDPEARGTKFSVTDDGSSDAIAGRVGFLAKGNSSKKLSDDERENFEVIGEKLSGGKEPVANEDEPDEKEIENLEQIAFDRDRPVDTSILTRLPIPVLVYRDKELLFANPEFFELTGYSELGQLQDAGGVDTLFGANEKLDHVERGQIYNSDGETLSVEPHLQRVPWDDDRAMLLTLRRSTQTSVGDKRGHNSGEGGSLPRAANLRLTDDETLARMEAAFGDLGVEDLRNILDTATDGIIILSDEGIVQAMNRSAEALFDTESGDVAEQSITRLLAPESQRTALDYVASVSGPGVASLLNDGREIIGRTSKGGLVPLFMTVGKLEKTNACCAVMRDITQWKKVEEEMVTAKSAAELANAQKSEFLAKVSHEIRTPLNAIIGFSDLMIEERFGKIDNDRYRGYLRDIKSSGSHVLDLINDLLDISKIEAGRMDLNFDACDLNTIVSETVAIMQPDANKERVIIRTSLSAVVPKIVADPRSLKQIILNLVSNSVKYTKSGGQVIVSTVYENSGDVALRVRDTGVGMSEAELSKAMEPFQQVSDASNASQKGTGLGLPLTKAMIEANRAEFHIESVPDEGTLVEVHFPIQRVLADR